MERQYRDLRSHQQSAAQSDGHAQHYGSSNLGRRRALPRHRAIAVRLAAHRKRRSHPNHAASRPDGRSTLRRLRRPLGPIANVEEIEDLMLVQTKSWRRAVLCNYFLEQTALRIEHFGDAILDCAVRNKACHDDRILLPDTVSASDRLVLDGRVPPAVEEKDIIRELQIQSDAAGAITHQDHVNVRVAPEAVQHTGPFSGWDFPVEEHNAD